MSGKAGIRRADHHINDGQHRIQVFVDCLRDIGASTEVDAPADANGEWWIDVAFGHFKTEVAWRRNRGFGVFTSADTAYGDQPDEVYREPALAVKRLQQLARRPQSKSGPMHLSEVRNLVDETQHAIAGKLQKNQGLISRLERQDDALLSTVRDYVEALGGEVRLVVRFDGFEAPVSLPVSQLGIRVVKDGPPRKGRSRAKSASTDRVELVES